MKRPNPALQAKHIAASHRSKMEKLHDTPEARRMNEVAREFSAKWKAELEASRGEG